ncbi:UDP-3-O-(3-hydroxymyristoyl)glucosamine N-acyltransferase [Dietzia sp. SLG510A3-30A2]|nr:UDP-3-O-(3-hydroxymyristoyl)glucosamine N-acyltransferase [Dietzia sp. SLG510A3-30A2]
MPTVGDVKRILGIKGPPNDEIQKVDWVSSLDDPKDNTVSYVKTWDQLSATKVASHPRTLFLAPRELLDDMLEPVNCVIVENPRLSFAIVASKLFAPRKSGGVAPTAFVGAGVDLGEGASVGHNAVIETGARVGARVTIGHNSVIHSGVDLGDDVIIGSNSVIGSIGFGLERDAWGVPHRIPHLGGVKIGDRVEIGSCCTVARGTIQSTLLEDEVKVDDSVFVGHNVQVRRGAFLTAGTITCGSADIGRRSWIAPGSIVINKASVGDDVMLGLGAVVVDDVPSESLTVGVPARVRGRNPMLPPEGYEN